MVGHADTLSITETRERKEFWSSKTRDGKLKPGFKVAVRQSKCRVRASKCQHSEEGSKEAEARSGTIEFTCNSPSTNLPSFPCASRLISRLSCNAPGLQERWCGVVVGTGCGGFPTVASHWGHEPPCAWGVTSPTVELFDAATERVVLDLLDFLG